MEVNVEVSILKKFVIEEEKLLMSMRKKNKEEVDLFVGFWKVEHFENSDFFSFLEVSK
jgi:hypothetical protein